MSVDHVGIVGTGLVGTSIGLALARAGQRALLVDADPTQTAAAAALGAGVAAVYADLERCDHIVAAVPPRVVGQVIARLAGLNPSATMSDVASTKSNVLADVETMSCDPSRFCGGHPIAGRERGGPGAAQPTLFDGAVWTVTPLHNTGSTAADDVAELARRCGARPLRVSAAEHDWVLATVSHAPQLVASALAAALPGAGTLGPALAGAGFRDTTRLAEGDPALWAEIATDNAAALADVLDGLTDRLAAASAALRRRDAAAIMALVAAGNAGRALLPGKAGRRLPDWARVGVVLADRPGELGRLLSAAGAAGVNVEDLTIDHAADHPVGYVDLHVRRLDVDRLLAAVRSAGWEPHPND